MGTVPAADRSGGGGDGAAVPLVCTVCGSGDELVIEAIQSTIPAVPGLVSIEYSCADCEFFYAHDASVAQVAELLPAHATVQGVLHFGDHFIHCGEPMEEVREVISRRNTGAPDGTVAGGLVRTRVFRCRCGFRLDVPL